jgi:hypothetical protein
MPSEIPINERTSAAKMRGFKLPDSDEDVFRMAIHVVVELRIVTKIAGGPRMSENKISSAKHPSRSCRSDCPRFFEG